jgi:hypothetical protein
MDTRRLGPLDSTETDSEAPLPREAVVGHCTFCSATRPVDPCPTCAAVTACADCGDALGIHLELDRLYEPVNHLPLARVCRPCGEAHREAFDTTKHMNTVVHQRMMRWLDGGDRRKLRYCDTCRRVYEYSNATDRNNYEKHLQTREHRQRRKIRALHKPLQRRCKKSKRVND